MIINQEKYNYIPIISVYFLALVLIKVIVLDNFNYIFFVTIGSIGFIVYNLKSILGIKKLYVNINEFKWIVNSILIYTIFVLGLTVFKVPKAIIYSINILTPFLTMIFLIYDMVEYEYIILNIKKIIIYIFLGTSIAALIMLCFGYSKIDISFDHILTFIPTKDYIATDNEIRLAWLTSHKSRYALYCLIGILFIYNTNLVDRKIKNISILLLYINLFLTSSLTSIAIGIVAWILLQYKKIFEFINKHKWSKYIIIVTIFIGFITTVIYISGRRNILTLGSRLYIWQSAIGQIVKEPMGIVAMGKDFLMSNENLNFLFTNGHNIFLNELIERGVIGTVLFLFIFISIFKLFYNSKNYYYIYANIVCILGGLIDYTIAEEMTYIFWFINAIWCAESILYLKNRNIIRKR